MKLKLFTSLVLFISVYNTRAQYTPINETVAVTYYVDTSGNDVTNSGTSLAKPFRTIKKAFASANTQKRLGRGVKISIGEGTYREGANTDTYPWATLFTNNPVDATSAPLIIEGRGWNAANPQNTGKVILSSSELFSGGWTKVNDSIWTKTWPYSFTIQSRTSYQGGVPFTMSDAMLRREWLYVNGKTYYCVNAPNYTNINTVSGFPLPANANGERLTADEGSFWINNNVITIKPPLNERSAFDLNAKTVEVTTKRGIVQLIIGTFEPAVKTNIIIRNLTFKNASEREAFQINRHNNVLIEDCRFDQNKINGFTVQNCRNVLVRRCTANGNGNQGAGISGSRNVVFDSCYFNENARQGEIVNYTSWSVCGIKSLRDSAVVFSHCLAKDNRGSGFWWDTGNEDCDNFECVSSGNSNYGVYVEANSAADNNYENMGTGLVGTEGIVNLGDRPTVSIIRCLVTDNQPKAGMGIYRPTKGAGVWISESENVFVTGSMVYGNSIQVTSNNNDRGEIRKVHFKDNLFGITSVTQRLYAYGNSANASETINVYNSATPPVYITTIKGAWYALFDGMSGTTNDNLYYYPNTIAFLARSQRQGTNVNPIPTLTLPGWQSAHLNNSFNLNATKNVDSRSRLDYNNFGGVLPLVGVKKLKDTLKKSDTATQVFVFTRVAPLGYASPLTVNYSFRNFSGDAINGIDFQLLSGSITIPAGEDSINLVVTPISKTVKEPVKPIVCILDTANSNYVVANTTDSLYLKNTSTTLPVSFLSYKASMRNNASFLEWTTANEQNNDGFIIERSVNGIEWVQLGFVKALSSNNITNSYAFWDNQPLKAINYYRLAQRDIDGNKSFSTIVQLDFSKIAKPSITVFPNPVENEQTIIIRLENMVQKKAQLQVYKTNGQLIDNMSVSPLNSMIKLDAKKFAKGLYLIKLKEGSHSITQSFLVK